MIDDNRLIANNDSMGRVIDGNHGNDGGIWAEMLADRKFYHPVAPSKAEAAALRRRGVKTKSPWRARAGRRANATSSPRPPGARRLTPLVRDGRHVQFDFWDDASPECHSVVQSLPPSQFGSESDSESGPESEAMMEPWSAEIEQSGVPLEKGRAYRGHVWVTSLSTDDDDDDDDEDDDDENGTMIALEVWLRFKDRHVGAAPLLLARIVNRGDGGGTYNDDDDDGGDDDHDDNNHDESDKDALPSDGSWKRLSFGFTCPWSTKADCECGVDPLGRADCAGDCRRGDGRGGFNKANRNGAVGGLGEDALGHCGACGAALAVVARRVPSPRATTVIPKRGKKQQQRRRRRRRQRRKRTTKQQQEQEKQQEQGQKQRRCRVASVGVGAASLMPADAVAGIFRRDTLLLLRGALRPSILRWPGGNFASGYDWRDGVGWPRDARPTRKNPSWAGTVSNDFGVM